MSLTTFYYVAAAAAAVLVTNWFCGPLWRRTEHQQETQRQDRDALLQPEARIQNHSIAQEEQSDVGQSYQPPEPTAEKAPQVPAAAASQRAPDAIGSASGGPEPNGEEKEKHTGPPQAALALAASRTSPPPPTTTVATSAEPTPAPAPAATPAPGPVPPPAPVDEDYLKSLIDQELGPPKFEVPKQPAPEDAGSRGTGQEASRDQQLRGDTRISLEELLEQEFGPPKFAVPKAASPKAAPAAQGAPGAAGGDAGGDAGDSDVPVPGSAGAGGSSSSSSTKAKKPPVGGGRDPAKRAAALIAAGQQAAAAAAAGGGSNGGAAAAGADAGGTEGAGAGGLPLGRMSWSGTKRPQEALRGEGAGPGEEGEGTWAGAGGGLAVLTLDVTQGPEAGKRFVADDPSTEYKLGRLPECSFQVLDQEISGRHASVRWDAAEGSWMLHDVGSLNGTSLNGRPIGRDYKQPGTPVPLSHGDVVELGSLTRLVVALQALGADRGAGGGAGGAEGGEPAHKRHHADPGLAAAEASTLLTPTAPSSFDTIGAAGALAAAAATGVLSSGALEPLLLQDYPQLGARLCVHSRLGVDHKRLGQGCDDVPHWELPFQPYDGAGIVCVFDGHHGSTAANQAREFVPLVLRHRLLARDGREAAPLPPPPPPRPPRRPEEQEEEEEELDEGYNGSSEDEGEQQEGGKREGVEAQGAGEGKMQGADGAKQQAEAGDGEDGKEEGAEEAVEAAEGAEAGEQAAVELLPLPPAGPPLPRLLRGRSLESQQALLKDVFLTSDSYMSMEEGCTATLVLLEADAREGWVLQSANVGDSSAVLVNYTQGTWSRLSADHRIASSQAERDRLAARGHTVRTRLYGLNISRMLGDRFLKEEDLGFLAEPHVGPSAAVGPGDWAVLLVASDGLWDVLPEERAAKLLLQDAAKAGVGPNASSSASPDERPALLSARAVASLLLGQAMALRSKDDITVSVLELGPHLWAQQ